MEHHPNFWNTTPSAQQRDHKPARVGVLVQLFGTPGPPTRPRTTPYMVRVLVQHLENHPTEPQGPDRESGDYGTLFDDGWSRPALGHRKKQSCLDHFSMRADQPKVAARNYHVCQLGQSESSGPLFDGDTEPQQCLVYNHFSPQQCFSLSSLWPGSRPTWWFPP